MLASLRAFRLIQILLQYVICSSTSPPQSGPDTAFSQAVIERALSYGNVEIFTAGTSTEDLVFESVPQPEQVKRTLTFLLSEQDQGDGLR